MRESDHTKRRPRVFRGEPERLIWNREDSSGIFKLRHIPAGGQAADEQRPHLHICG